MSIVTTTNIPTTVQGNFSISAATAEMLTVFFLFSDDGSFP